MSCILYNKASYDALARTPTFQSLWRDLFASTYYESPEAFAAALFELNARAFRDRYREDIETSEEVQAARIDTNVERFAETVRVGREACSPRALAALWSAFKSIEYQCSDAHDAHDLETYWHLGWAKDWCARAMCEQIEQAERRAA
jgi:hypothetical protein